MIHGAIQSTLEAPSEPPGDVQDNQARITRPPKGVNNPVNLIMNPKAIHRASHKVPHAARPRVRTGHLTGLLTRPSTPALIMPFRNSNRPVNPQGDSRGNLKGYSCCGSNCNSKEGGGSRGASLGASPGAAWSVGSLQSSLPACFCMFAILVTTIFAGLH